MRRRSDPIDELASIDPIDGDQLTASWSNSDAKQALLEEITTMPVDTLLPPSEPIPATHPVRQRAPRRVLGLAAGAAAAAVVLVLVQGVLSDSNRAFAIRPLPNGVIEIEASPQFRDGEALAAELREFGIDVKITTLPASPSMVGEVEVFAPGGGDYIPEGLTFGADGTPGVFDLQIDPNVFAEQLTLELHVAALEGERYLVASDVFGPGEVLDGLHCALGEPLRAEDLAPYLDRLGLTAVWTIISPTGDPSITNSEQVVEVPMGRVFSGFPQDSNTVAFEVLLDGVTLPDIYTPSFLSIPCTPEQAAVWN